MAKTEKTQLEYDCQKSNDNTFAVVTIKANKALDLGMFVLAFQQLFEDMSREQKRKKAS